jgi:hypothetical protein
MNKVVTFLFSIIFVIGIQQAFAAPEIDDEVIVAFDSDVKVIPDWVKTTMGYYLSDQISEREILDALNKSKSKSTRSKKRSKRIIIL